MYRSRPCPHCNGSGVAREPTKPSAWARIRAWIKDLAFTPPIQRVGASKWTYTPNPLPYTPTNPSKATGINRSTISIDIDVESLRRIGLTHAEVCAAFRDTCKRAGFDGIVGIDGDS
jgi:hypothetical protein